MEKKRKGSLVFLVVFISAAVLVGFYGVKAHFEREVYVTVIENILGKDRAGIPRDTPLSIFISRPYQCEVSTAELEADPVLVNMKSVNKQGASPIPLNAIEGRVPIVSWEDTKRIASAGYLWNQEDRGLVWVSRVGFSGLFENAAICLANSKAAHSWGTIFVLKRSGLQWDVVLAEHSARAI